MDVEIVRGLEPPFAGAELPFDALDPGDAMWVSLGSARVLGRACVRWSARYNDRHFIARNDLRGAKSGAYVYCIAGRAPERKPRLPRRPTAQPLPQPEQESNHE